MPFVEQKGKLEISIEFQIVSEPARIEIAVCGKTHFERARKRDKKVMLWLSPGECSFQ